MAQDPFAPSRSRAGYGEAHVCLLLPSTPVFRNLNYTYPLKLITSSPYILQQPENGDSSKHHDAITRPTKVPLLFMLTYGGGLLPTDSISLDVILEASTRLTLATQGSTKVFPTDVVSTIERTQVPSQATAIKSAASQHLHVKLGAHSGLLLCPDPVQPFQGSHYSQVQIFKVDATASLGLLDWVTSGRPAREEVWEAGSWTGRNEIWRSTGGSSDNRRLLLRDAVYLEGGPDGIGQRTLRTERKGVFGTLILLGPIFRSMENFFLSEFAMQPKVGGYKWDEDENVQSPPNEVEIWRKNRLLQEKEQNVLWTAARVRGLVVVKFTAQEAEGAKAWLNSMFQQEGTIEREFGPGGLLSLR